MMAAYGGLFVVRHGHWQGIFLSDLYRRSRCENYSSSPRSSLTSSMTSASTSWRLSSARFMPSTQPRRVACRSRRRRPEAARRAPAQRARCRPAHKLILHGRRASARRTAAGRRRPAYIRRWRLSVSEIDPFIAGTGSPNSFGAKIILFLRCSMAQPCHCQDRPPKNTSSY